MAFLFLNLGAQHFSIWDNSSRYPLYLFSRLATRKKDAAPIGASEKLSLIYQNLNTLFTFLLSFSLFPFSYHLIIALAQVNPLPNAAKTTLSPFLIFPCSQASVKAIGMEAAVVFPYF